MIYLFLTFLGHCSSAPFSSKAANKFFLFYWKERGQWQINKRTGSKSCARLKTTGAPHMASGWQAPWPFWPFFRFFFPKKWGETLMTFNWQSWFYITIFTGQIMYQTRTLPPATAIFESIWGRRGWCGLPPMQVPNHLWVWEDVGDFGTPGTIPWFIPISVAVSGS